MNMMKKLRDRIDWLDTQIVSLLNERMKAADQIGKIKKVTQQNVTDPSREKNVLSQVEMLVQHPVLKADIANIYREIMQESRIAQQFFRHLTLPFHRIGVVGLGLMGGSICKAIKMKDPSIVIGTPVHASEDLSKIQEEGWIDHTYSSYADLIQNSELIILASPISTIMAIAEEIRKNSAHDKKLLVMDIASVKRDIVETFEKLSCEQVQYIGTHPMSGKEKSGFTNSQATLFVNKPWVVVPHKQNNEEGIHNIKELIRFLGADPITLTAEIHDQQAALISHIPSILSKSYFDFVTSVNPESLLIAGPGFQSFTRLAHGSTEMRTEIVEANKESIQSYLNQWLSKL